MEKIAQLNDNGKNLVRMGMVDSKIAEPMFFLVDVENPMRAIRLARAKFLRKWVKLCRLQRGPNINLFFEIPEDEWMFLHDRWCGECKNGKRLSLNRETMSRAVDIIESFLRAHKMREERWECWRKQKIGCFSDLCPPDEKEKTKLRLVKKDE